MDLSGEHKRVKIRHRRRSLQGRMRRRFLLCSVFLVLLAVLWGAVYFLTKPAELVPPDIKGAREVAPPPDL